MTGPLRLRTTRVTDTSIWSAGYSVCSRTPRGSELTYSVRVVAWMTLATDGFDRLTRRPSGMPQISYRTQPTPPAV